MEQNSGTSMTGRPWGPDVTDAQAQVLAILERAILLGSVSDRAGASSVAELMTLSASARDGALDPAQVLCEQALTALVTAWESGWQPLDLAHVVRHRLSRTAADWVIRAVLAEAVRSQAMDRGPQAWVDQLVSLEDSRGTDLSAPLLDPWGAASASDWSAALAGVGQLQRLPRSTLLMPPPSAWDSDRATRVTRRSASDPQMLRRIRALLAKAESTSFPAEADAFSAKAQDLMTRHAIDEALLQADGELDVEAEARRVLIDSPYSKEKIGLLHHVGAANRCSVVWNVYSRTATLVGVSTDLERVEMLFTSLLVQATRAMTAAGSSAGAADRTTGFRKSFLRGYAVRIAARLSEASTAAVATYGSAIVPVLERQELAVRHEVNRLFPRLRDAGNRTMTFDPRGWSAGTRAADEAVLPAGQVESRP